MLKVKLFIAFMLVLGFVLTPRTMATEYEGDGTYTLRIGDYIKASNGYIVVLRGFWGRFYNNIWLELGTMLEVFSPEGESKEIGGWGNWSCETHALIIDVKRYAINGDSDDEAVVTVTSKYNEAPIEYEGDGKYRLLVGDSIKASNGYIVKLVWAFGEVGSRSDWWTILDIYDPQGEYVGSVGGWGNYTYETCGPRETETLYIYIERYVAEEAVITVISKYEIASEFSNIFYMVFATLLMTIIFARLAKYRKMKCENL